MRAGPPASSRLLEREDAAVRSTNDDATVGKWCAVRKGYYADPFVDAFLVHEPERQLGPLMNRGHYARVQAIQVCVGSALSLSTHSLQLLVERFLGPVEGWPPARQVVGLGAGFDTLYFRLASTQPALVAQLRYFECDFPQVVKRKRHVLEVCPCTLWWSSPLSLFRFRAMRASVPLWTATRCLSAICATLRSWASRWPLKDLTRRCPHFS